MKRNFKMVNMDYQQDTMNLTEYDLKSFLRVCGCSDKQIDNIIVGAEKNDQFRFKTNVQGSLLQLELIK